MKTQYTKSCKIPLKWYEEEIYIVRKEEKLRISELSINLRSYRKNIRINLRKGERGWGEARRERERRKKRERERQRREGSGFRS